MNEKEINEIKNIVRNVLEEEGLSAIDDSLIDIRNSPLTKGEVFRQGVIIKVIRKINNLVICTAKFGLHTLKILVFIGGVHWVAQFFGELMTPGSVPDVQEVAQIVKKGFNIGYEYLKAEETVEPERFVVIQEDWERWSFDKYKNYLAREVYNLPDYIAQSEKPVAWQFVS